MNAPIPAPRPAAPTFAELFTPKLITVLREGYGFKELRADALAGLTVAIVALPLSMAIAIASGVGPERGLFTAVVGGFLISLLGGSRFQIGGPAGAFIVLVSAIVEREGYEGLAFAVMIAGCILVTVGLLRLGTFIKYIPYPVTVGFTAGIAVIIVASQVHELFGLRLASEPASFLPKLSALWAAASTANPATVGIAALSLATILSVQRWYPRWPSFLIATVVGAAVTALLHLDVVTIGSRFGAMPEMLPAPHLPILSWPRVHAALINGCAIALLGAIESLLSAVVADGMTGRRHRSNCELVAQGIANVASSVFGGIAVTGTVARTATSVRSGARGPIAGMFHAAYVLLFMVVAAPLVAYVPLATLGAVLTVVAWNMAEKEQFWVLIRSSRGDAMVLLLTFGLTVLVDLTTGIAVGVVLGAFLFLHRMAESVEIAGGPEFLAEDQADSTEARPSYDPAAVTDPDVMLYRISGALFFGATAAVGTALDRIGTHPKVFVLDFQDVPLIDVTAAKTLVGFTDKLHRSGTKVGFVGARHSVRHALVTAGLTSERVVYGATLDDVLRSVGRA
jgi:SulP family sulfate permease